MTDELQIEHTGYFLVPDDIFEVEKLSIHAQAVYHVLCRHANTEGKCWPGHTRIARMARCSVPSVKRGIEELQKTEPPLLIVRLRKKGKQKDTNLYLVRRKDLLGGRVPQTLGVGSDRTEGRVPQSYKGLHNEVIHNEGLVVPMPKFSFSLKEGFVGIPYEDLSRWAEAYPAVDIAGEIKRAAEWLRANPTKLKRNYRKFLTGWFSRKQEWGGTKGYRPPAARPAPAPIQTPEPLSDSERQENERILAELKGDLAKAKRMPVPNPKGGRAK